MGKLADDLNRLNAAAVQGNVLLNGHASPCRSRSDIGDAPKWTPKPGPLRLGTPSPPLQSWARNTQSCISKTKLVPRHSSCDFVTNHYEVVRELGRGSFSHVKLVREKRTGHERVCKVVRTEQMTSEVLQLTKTEVQVLAELDHPSIVKLYEYAEDSPRHKLVLILEYIAGGDCSGLLEGSDRTLSEARVARLIHQLLVAVNCCHARGIFHRDLKPQNMMLTRSLGAWGSPNLKVIDFGLAARARSSRDFVGTPAYMPPEVLAGTVDYTSQADMWSIGVTAAELLAGEPPFGRPEDFSGDMEPVFENIRRFGSFDDIADTLEDMPNWAGRSDEAKDFVRQLLRADPQRRSTAVEALAHPWIEQCKPAQGGLPADMVRSMADFAEAPPLLRCCMLVVAGRTGISEAARVGAAFTDADADEDGTISREELVDAIASASTCGWSSTEVDAGGVFAAADLGCSGMLGFTEFAAATLYSRYGKNLDRLAEQAFAALDDDRDGWVRLSDVLPLFHGEAQSALTALPQDRHFQLGEWRTCIKAMQEATSESAERRGRELLLPDAESEGPLVGFLKYFLVDHFLCSTCEQCRDEDDTSLRYSPPVVVANNYDPNTEVPVFDYEEAADTVRVV